MLNVLQRLKEVSLGLDVHHHQSVAVQEKKNCSGSVLHDKAVSFSLILIAIRGLVLQILWKIDLFFFHHIILLFITWEIYSLHLTSYFCQVHSPTLLPHHAHPTTYSTKQLTKQTTKQSTLCFAHILIGVSLNSQG